MSYADRLFTEHYYAANARAYERASKQIERERLAEAACEAEREKYYAGHAREDGLYVYKFCEMNDLVEQSFTDSYSTVQQLKIDTGRALDNATRVGWSLQHSPAGTYYLADVPIRIIMFPKEYIEAKEAGQLLSHKLYVEDTFLQEYDNLPILIVRNNILYVNDERGSIQGTSNMLIKALVVQQ